MKPASRGTARNPFLSCISIIVNPRFLFVLSLLVIRGVGHAAAPTGEPSPVNVVSLPAMQVSAVDAQILYLPDTPLVTSGQARVLVEKFRVTYGRLGRPRLLVFVNRKLVDSGDGFKSTGRGNAASAAPGGAEKAHPAAAATPHPPAAQGGDSPSFASLQIVRDIERLFARPLRAGGATLTDQATAAAFVRKSVSDQSGASATEPAPDQIAAFKKVTDVVIEILIASKNLTVPAVSGDKSYIVPDIQATAIRLKDGGILAQASTIDVLGGRQQAARIARQYTINDIAEATAFALMEDMARSAE